MFSPVQTVSFRPRIQSADESVRPTRAEVDLSAIAHNLRVVQAAADGVDVLAVVKADAYGHGVVPVARYLQVEGVAGFGVALAEEGLELRDAGITADILVLNGVYGGAHEAVLAAELVPVVYDLGEIEAFHRAARNEVCRVHLKVDTGMARLGVTPDQLPEFLEGLRRWSGVRIEGVMSHFAAADSDAEFTQEQLKRFRSAISMVRAYGHPLSVLHIANTAALFRHPDAKFKLVRPGIALYGYAPGVNDLSLRPAMRLRTEIIALRTLPSGSPVGYGASHRVSRTSRIATVPVGYGDGLLRAASSQGHMLVRGERCPLVGPIAMDLTSLDVTDVPGVSIGDEVVLLGAQGAQAITADDLGQCAQTIPYEILTNVSRRVPRFYKYGLAANA